jgi:queuine tRNA-ribosyltransferase
MEWTIESAQKVLVTLLNVSLQIKQQACIDDLQPIDAECECATCARGISRAYLNRCFGHEPVVASMLTVHNLHFMLDFMRQMRKSIVEQRCTVCSA